MINTVSIPATVGSENGEVRRGAVERFIAGWAAPDPHAWDDLLARGVELRQPLMPDGVGLEHWQRELRYLLAFLPDLRGEVLNWTGDGDVVYINIRCTATVAGRAIAFQAVDRLTLDQTGLVVRRDSYFDPIPVVISLACRPSAWVAWWRSGAAPLPQRRRLLSPALWRGCRNRPPVAQQAIVALGITRVGVSLIAVAGDRRTPRSVRRARGPSRNRLLSLPP